MVEQNKDGSLTKEYIEHLKGVGRCKKVGTDIITSYLVKELGYDGGGFLLDFDLSFDKKTISFDYQDLGTIYSYRIELKDFLNWLCID